MLTVVMLVVMLTLGSGAVLWLARRPSYQRFVQYGRFERRMTFRAVKAGRPLDERQVQIARATTDLLRRQKWLDGVLPTAAVVWLVGGFLDRHEPFGKVALGMGLLYLLGLPFLWRQRGRGAERLRQALEGGRPS